MRGRGEGSIYRRADGYWVGAVEAGRTPAGKRRRLRVVRRRRGEVVSEMRRLAAVAEADVAGDRNQTVERYLEWWLDEVKEGDVGEDTLDDYRGVMRRWVVPYVGHHRLSKLRVAHVQQMVNELRRAGRSPRVVSKALKLLRSALRYAVGSRLVDFNPAEHVNGISPPVDTDVAMTAAEARATLDAAADDRLYGMWWLALKYGIRLGELTSLRWDDIAEDELAVRSSKTRAGVRTLPLIGEARAVLDAHRRRQAAERLAAEAWIDEGLVFCREDGRALDHRRVGEAWRDLLQRAGVERRRFHAARHTAATLLLEAGVPLETVSAILGHASISITADTYAKVRADLQRRGLERLS